MHVSVSVGYLVGINPNASLMNRKTKLTVNENYAYLIFRQLN